MSVFRHFPHILNRYPVFRMHIYKVRLTSCIIPEITNACFKKSCTNSFTTKAGINVFAI
jgi:hypothetical protein